jgi:predicted metal-dependent hydrolase
LTIGRCALTLRCRVIEMTELPPAYLRGIEQFNAGEFFACHETLEELWQAAPLGEERVFLQALIQAAAALHHFQQGNLKGAASLSQRAILKLRWVRRKVMQLDTRHLADDLQCFFEQAAANTPCAFPDIHLNHGSKT